MCHFPALTAGASLSNLPPLLSLIDRTSVQEYSADVAAEYARHFTTGELVISAGPEAVLRRTLLKRVDVAMLRDLCEQYRSTRSCVVKVQEHTAGVTEAELLAVRHCWVLASQFFS